MPTISELASKYWKWMVAALLLSAFLYVYLPCALSILYNYYWWIRYYDTVQYAAPVTVPEGFAEPLVPKILHQTWRDKNVPDKWKEAQQSCIDAHPGYEYKLWTDEEAEKLIADKFPWFLDTYKAYPHNIQRADVLRYFVLYEYGGIYLDLDVQCVKSLDYLRFFNFTAPKTYPIGVSNDVMISRPKDPFAKRLTENLAAWQKWFFVKYATVMFSTGPMFVTIQFTLYRGKDEFTVLPADVYGKYEITSRAYLKHLHGSSWHGNDAKYVFWLEHHAIFTACLVTVVLATALTALLVHRHRIAAQAAAAAGAHPPPHPFSNGQLGIALSALLGQHNPYQRVNGGIKKGEVP